MAETHHKAVLITGAGKRIGRALAEALATDGWAIAAHYAGSKSEAEALIAEITDKGGKGVALQADLRDAAAVETLVTDAAAALGPLSALINNASTFERDTAHTLTAESWDTHINANLRAPALLMRDFANQAALQNDGSVPDACIINITDQRVDRLTPDFTSYTVSKTGLATLTETFRASPRAATYSRQCHCPRTDPTQSAASAGRVSTSKRSLVPLGTWRDT